MWFSCYQLLEDKCIALLTHPGYEAMPDILRHGFVFFQLFEEDVPVEAADLLQVTEDDGLPAAQRSRNLAGAHGHRSQEAA